MELDYPNKVEKYRWFAKALLEGDVMEKMKKFSKHYLASPSIMLKSWARYLPQPLLLPHNSQNFRRIIGFCVFKNR